MNKYLLVLLSALIVSIVILYRIETFATVTLPPINITIIYSTNPSCATDLCKIANLNKLKTTFNNKKTKKGRTITINVLDIDKLTTPDKIKYQVEKSPLNKTPAVRQINKVNNKDVITIVSSSNNTIAKITKYLNDIILKE
jgi:hypothetical protein